MNFLIEVTPHVSEERRTNTGANKKGGRQEEQKENDNRRPLQEGSSVQNPISLEEKRSQHIQGEPVNYFAQHKVLQSGN